MQQEMKKFIETHHRELFDKWLAEMGQVHHDKQLKSIGDEAYKRYNQEFFNILLQQMQHGDDVRDEEISEFADKMEKLAWPLFYIQNSIRLFKRELLNLYLAKMGRESYPEFSGFLEEQLDPMANLLIGKYSQYTGTWEQTINMQRMALRELSAPLIPVFDSVSVMPLIGTIDTERAKYIMENLLEGIIEHESQVVLLDITGVPVVDTMVAHHIIQATEAVRLVGAKCIIVGIRPEIAQTIVTLGIDLADIATMSSLQKGIHVALEYTGKRVVDQNGRT